jgi:hypothetical protein
MPCGNLARKDVASFCTLPGSASVLAYFSWKNVMKVVSMPVEDVLIIYSLCHTLRTRQVAFRLLRRISWKCVEVPHLVSLNPQNLECRLGPPRIQFYNFRAQMVEW